MKCMMKNQVNCASINGPKRGCNCIPYNTLKTYFDVHPIPNNTTWNACQSNAEYRECFNTMYDCYYHKMVRNVCPKPCKRVVWRGIDSKLNGIPIKSNEMAIKTKFSTMDIEYQDEVWVQEFYNFVGTVGGSLGLFIGFSYTGFITEILDYFHKR